MWPDAAKFRHLGYFLKASAIFFLKKVVEKNGDILGYFLIWSKSSIFTLISCFKTCFDVDILNFKKSFVVDVLDFKIGFDVDILAFFCSAIFLATFCQISAIFFSNRLVTLYWTWYQFFILKSFVEEFWLFFEIQHHALPSHRDKRSQVFVRRWRVLRRADSGRRQNAGQAGQLCHGRHRPRCPSGIYEMFLFCHNVNFNWKVSVFLAHNYLFQTSNLHWNRIQDIFYSILRSFRQ